MMQRRTLLAASAAMLAAPRIGAAVTVGVTATELKIGNFMPYSGPASAYGVIGRGDAAYFKMINDQGGVGGRQINFISYDDGYSPPRAVEQTRRLVEQDRVALLFHTLGTPSNSAIVRYVNQRRVPHLFLATGADKWGNYQDTPWTIGWQPSYRTEAQIYAKWMLEQKPNAKVALLYQNDDFGKDYVTGVKDVLGARFDQMVTTASYEVTDPTVDSQVVSLRGTGADVLITAATPKFAAQTIRKVHDIGWQPMHFLSNVAISIAAVMRPAGPERGIGIITSAYQKDITDPVWNDDRHMQGWREFMRKYLPEADMSDSGYATAYNVSFTLMQVLRQCEGDFSRENIMRQVANVHDLEVPLLLPGIKVNTSPTNFHPIRQMQLQKWSGAHWERFGDVIQGADV